MRGNSTEPLNPTLSIFEFLNQFQVVEVNFSSRRSGQEVLRRVEEATLSRRLSTGASVDDKHCLLLFRDIDQVYPEEDEGFHSALAQLIVASLRPVSVPLTL